MISESIIGPPISKLTIKKETPEKPANNSTNTDHTKLNQLRLGLSLATLPSLKVIPQSGDI